MRRSEAVDLKERFLGRLYNRYNSGNVRDGVHVSDLTYCVRQSFFRKTNPKPHSLRTLQFFVDGARRHEALQELLGVESEVPVERFGVKGTVDILGGLGPVEIKTTRAANAVPSHYFMQLSYYAAMLGVCEGFLVIQRINCKEGMEPWEFIHVVWSEEEMFWVGRDLEDKAKKLRLAFASGDGSGLPCLDSGMRWKCRYCLYSSECGGV